MSSIWHDRRKKSFNELHLIDQVLLHVFGREGIHKIIPVETTYKVECIVGLDLSPVLICDVDGVGLRFVIVDIVDINILVGRECPPSDPRCVQVILTRFHELAAVGVYN